MMNEQWILRETKDCIILSRDGEDLCWYHHEFGLKNLEAKKTDLLERGCLIDHRVYGL